MLKAAGSIPAASIPRSPAICGDRFSGSTQPLPKAAGSPLMFPDMEIAQEWLKRNNKEVLVGSIVLVAGAAFVIGTAGVGVLVLVPLAAL